MYCPVDKAKAIWLCVTLLVLFILVLCIVLPITVTHLQTDTCALDGCLFDDECVDRCIKETQSENPQIMSLTTESTSDPPAGTTTDSLLVTPPDTTTDPPSVSTADPPVSTTDSSVTDSSVVVTCSPTACNKACTLGC